LVRGAKAVFENSRFSAKSFNPKPLRIDFRKEHLMLWKSLRRFGCLSSLIVVLGYFSCVLGQETATAPRAVTPTKPSVPPVRPEVVHHVDVTYRQTVQGPLKLDVVVPQNGRGPFPTVVIIHAIGPFAKERKHYVPKAVEFAQAGYVGVVISYRHLPEVAYPGAIEDTEASIRWLRTHAAKYMIDPDRIAAVGYSGGGALACLLGMKRAEKVEGKLALPSSRVQAVVAYYPPTDFGQLHKDCKNGTVPFLQGYLIASGFETWLGGTPSKVPDKYAQASPITHVCKDTAPILLIHGMDDGVVPIGQAQVLANKINAKKGRVTFLALAGAGHALDDGETPNAQIAKSAATTFLAEYLRPGVPRRGDVAQR
jgi:acetyl esterase/lipase